MKKIIKILLTICLFCGFISNVYAESNINEICTYVIPDECVEINPSNEIKEIAKSNNMTVRSFKSIKETSPSINYINSNEEITHGEIEIKNYFISREDLARASGNKYEESGIVYYSATVYSTIYYDRKTENNISYAKLTKVSGGVKDFNSGFYLVKQVITIGTFGAYDGNPISDQSVTKTTTNKTWSYSDFNFPYVNMTAYHNIGCNVDVTIKHGSSSYTGQHQNHY